MQSLWNGSERIGVEPVEQFRRCRRIPVARSARFNQIIVTGPPGAGKSTFIRAIGGWPEEGYVDLTARNWWRAQALAVRPRELHLGLPFDGYRRGLALFDADWLEHWRTLRLDEARLLTPPRRKHWFSVNWHGRFVFEFLLPSAETIHADRMERARQGTHPVDAHLDLEQIRAQVALFTRVATIFHCRGLRVFVRERVEDVPLCIALPVQPG
jgi:energy-coupling factor transporter ATP-binding protein EcfA2